jgi:hypothetical protein
VVCSNNGDFTAGAEGGNLVCSRNSCTGSVLNGVIDADYSSCVGSSTDTACTPACPPGYATSGASAAPALVCEDGGDFDVGADSGNLVCTINRCDGSVISGVSGANYSSCVASTTTGDTCTPLCQAGHTTTGVPAEVALVCQDNGNFDVGSDVGTLQCSSNTCGGSISNAVVNADYSACRSSTTGDSCTPLCQSGYSTTGSASGFELVCSASGDFDAGVDTGNLICTATTTATSTTSSRTISVVARFDCETWDTPIQVLKNEAGNGYEARGLDVETGEYANDSCFYSVLLCLFFNVAVFGYQPVTERLRSSASAMTLHSCILTYGYLRRTSRFHQLGHHCRW